MPCAIHNPSQYHRHKTSVTADRNSIRNANIILQLTRRRKRGSGSAQCRRSEGTGALNRRRQHRQEGYAPVGLGRCLGGEAAGTVGCLHCSSEEARRRCERECVMDGILFYGELGMSTTTNDKDLEGRGGTGGLLRCRQKAEDAFSICVLYRFQRCG